MKLVIILAAAFAVAVVSQEDSVGVPTATAATPDNDRNTARSQHRRDNVCPDHRAGLRFYRGRHAHWLDMRGIEVRYPQSSRKHICPYVEYLAVEWRDRAQAARKTYNRWLVKEMRERRALYAKWECIHRKEGAWNANTGNGYYGGLQMDMDFQRSHGPEFLARWGTADKWPVWAQIAAAEDAYQTRGFQPWPNTARACGLL